MSGNERTGPMLEATGLGHRYGARQALEGVDLCLERGVFHALVGPNGAGKSTLIGLITGLLPLQRGSLQLDGLSLPAHPRAARSRLGVVFQQPTLDLDLGVRQNLLYHAALHGLGRRQACLRCAEELARVGLAERANDKVRRLNGGHRRRLEIARALLHEPRLLVLDEASVGLDVAGRAALNDHVRALCRERGVSVLWATHLLDEIHANDPVVMLGGGRVLARGHARQLCRHTGSDSLPEAYNRLTTKARLARHEETPS